MEKGFKGTRNTNGRPKGAKNRTTAQTKELLQKIVGKELDKIEVLLDDLDSKERVDAIIKLLPYLLPRHSEIKAEITTDKIMTNEDRDRRIAELLAKAKSK